jgi:hypothetical protein
VLREQFGNRPIGGALLPELGDYFSGRGQFLETLRSARREFCDRLSD